MADLAAIVKATRASANAVVAMARANLRIATALNVDAFAAADRAQAAYRRAYQRYTRAQAVLAANPLPGDRT